MQAGPINPHPDIYNSAPADEFGEFGEEYDMLIIGHTLV